MLYFERKRNIPQGKQLCSRCSPQRALPRPGAAGTCAQWLFVDPCPEGALWGEGAGDRHRTRRTCHEKLSSTSRLSRSIGGSQGESSTVGFRRGGDRQFSAAIAKGDLHAGQRGRGNCLAIPKPAHLRNWETWREDSSPSCWGAGGGGTAKSSARPAMGSAWSLPLKATQGAGLLSDGETAAAGAKCKPADPEESLWLMWRPAPLSYREETEAKEAQ